jgi:hypothetical protein
VVVYDGFPKARVHLLLIPKVNHRPPPHSHGINRKPYSSSSPPTLT